MVGSWYRYVRNPMYVAVVTAIVGQGLWFAQPVLLGYAALVWIVVAAFVRWYEEPHLLRQFGEAYRVYLAAVLAGSQGSGRGSRGAVKVVEEEEVRRERENNWARRAVLVGILREHQQ